MAAGGEQQEAYVEEARNAALANDYDWFMTFIGDGKKAPPRKEPSEDAGAAPEMPASRTLREEKPATPQPYYDPEYSLNGDEADVTGEATRPRQRNDRNSAPEVRGDGDDKAEQSREVKDGAAAAPGIAEAALEPEKLSELLTLGYSAEEAASLGAETVELVLEMRTRRPKGGVPTDWLSPAAAAAADAAARQAEAERAPPKPRRAGGYYDDLYDDAYASDARASRRRPRESGEQRRKRPSQERQEQQLPRRRSSDAPRSHDMYWDDDEFERLDEPLVSWPNLDSFKNMLRKESEMRLGVVGPWAAEVVAAENRFRVNAYSAFLRALENGGEDFFSGPLEQDDGFDEWQFRDSDGRWHRKAPADSEQSWYSGGGGGAGGQRQRQQQRDSGSGDGGGGGGFDLGAILQGGVDALQRTLGGLEEEAESAGAERDWREQRQRQRRESSGAPQRRSSNREGGAEGVRRQRSPPRYQYEDEVSGLSDAALGLDDGDENEPEWRKERSKARDAGKGKTYDEDGAGYWEAEGAEDGAFGEEKRSSSSRGGGSGSGSSAGRSGDEPAAAQRKSRAARPWRDY